MLNLQNNFHLLHVSFDLAGNKKGFVWGINGSSKRASDYQNKYDGYVYNSKFNELNGGGYVGIEKDWGYTHFFVSQFNQKLGMIEGERDDEGRFTKPTFSNFASPAIKYSSFIFNFKHNRKKRHKFFKYK